jgi:hypothetical protein
MSTADPMPTTTMFCNACQKDVSVTCSPQPLHEGHANLSDSHQLLCFEFSTRCPTGRCPVSGLPSVVMGVRLARSGLQPENGWETIHMHCKSCEAITEMEVLDNVHAFCPACGTTSRWFSMNMGEEEYVVGMPTP